MTHHNDEALETLKSENLDLKLDGIRKDAEMFKNDVYNKLDLILEKTSETNDNVGKALDRIQELEKQDTETKVKELSIKLLQYEKETRPWRIIASNKWVRALIVFALSAMGLQLGVSIQEIIKSFIK